MGRRASRRDRTAEGFSSLITMFGQPGDLLEVLPVDAAGDRRGIGLPCGDVDNWRETFGGMSIATKSAPALRNVARMAINGARAE